MNDAEKLTAIIDQLASLRPMELVLTPESAWMVLATIQLAFRHPRFPARLRPKIESLKEALMDYLSSGGENELVLQLLKDGDNPEMDPDLSV